jgi:hypothetical protein
MLKKTCLEIDGFQHSLASILCCPLALVEMRPHPAPQWVSQILKKLVNNLFVVVYLR